MAFSGSGSHEALHWSLRGLADPLGAQSPADFLFRPESQPGAAARQGGTESPALGKTPEGSGKGVVRAGP